MTIDEKRHDDAEKTASIAWMDEDRSSKTDPTNVNP